MPYFKQDIASMSAGTTKAISGEIIFSNSNGISFGLDGQTITASHNGLTTAALSNHSHGNPQLNLTNLSGTTASNSNGLTLSLSANAQGLSNINLSGGTTSNNLSNFVFSNSNGVSFGLNGSTITATVQTNYLTTAALSNHSHGNPTLNLTNLSGTTGSNSAGLTLSLSAASPGITNANISAGTTSNNLSNFVLSNSNGVSFGLNGSTITASVATSLTNVNVSAGTTSNNLSAITFSNSNGITFGLNASTITASHNGLTTAALSNHSHGNPQLNLTNLSGTTASASNGLTLSLSANSPNINLSAGTTSNNLTNFVLSNSNGISFGLNGSTVTGSHNGLTSQSNQAFSAQGGSSGFQTLSFNNANGLTFSNNGGAIEASYTVPTVTNSSATLSDSATSIVLGRLAFTNSNGISFNLSTTTGGSATLIGSHNGLTSQSNQAVSASNGSYAFQTLSFSNANGMSFGTSAGSAIVGSYTVPSTAGLISAVNLSAGTTSNNLSALTFSNSNGITFGLNASTVTASHNGITSQSNQQITLFATGNTTQSSTGTSNASSLIFRAEGVASIGISNGSIVLSVPSGGGAGDGVNILAAGTQTANTTGTVLFNNANGISFGMNNSSVITASHNGLTNINVSAGTTSNNLSAITFDNQNGISFGLNAGVITGTIKTDYALSNHSHGNPTLALTNLTGTTDSNSAGLTLSLSGIAPFSAGISNIGITSGTSGLVGQQIVFAGVNRMLLSQSVNGNSATISIDDMQGTISSYENNVPWHTNFSAATNNGMYYGVGFLLPIYGSFDFLRLPASFSPNSTTIATLASASASASGALFSTLNAVVYSLGTGASSQSLISVTSTSGTYRFSQQISVTNSTQASYSLGFSGYANNVSTTFSTQYSVSNTNYSFTTNSLTKLTGPRMLDIPFAFSLPYGNYWMFLNYSTASSSAGAAGLAALTNCNVRHAQNFGMSQLNTSYGIMGASVVTTGGLPGCGNISTAGSGSISAFNLSAVFSQASNFKYGFQLLRSA